MPVPATKAQEVIERAAPLLDKVTATDELSLRRIIKECRDVLVGALHEDGATLFMLIGNAYIRLGDQSRAEEAFRNAHEQDKTDPHHANNYAAALMFSGRHAEALALLQTISLETIQDPYLRMSVSANLAEAFLRTNDTKHWRIWYGRSVENADQTNPYHLSALAGLSAMSGLDEDSVEYFARMCAVLRQEDLGETPALEYVEALPEKDRDRVALIPGFAAALERVKQRDAHGPDDFPRTLIRLSPEESRALVKSIVDAETHRPKAPSSR